MKLKIFKVFLPIILLVSSFFPMIYAPWTNVSPIDETDDAFITGVGNYFGDTPYLFLRDQTTSLLVGTRFRNLAISQGEKINNATLFVRSIYDYPAAGDISVTIRGDDIDDSLAFNDSGSFTRTHTSSYVVWNISEVNGNAWHNVTVTNIVQEIIDRPGWISGNDLSLLFWAIKGTPRREFASVDGNPAYTAYLSISYGEDPPEAQIPTIQANATIPYNDTEEYVWVYNHTYRGIDVYIATEIGKWLNFSTFTVMGGDAGKISGLNDTHFQATNVYTYSDVYMRRDFGAYRDNTSEVVAVRFGIRWEGMPWAGPPNFDYVNLWGFSNEHDRAFHWTKGYSFAERTWADRAQGTAWSVSAALQDSLTWSPQLMEAGLPFYLYYDIRINYQFAVMNVSVWNDVEMTDLNATYNAVFAPFPVYPWTPTYEYLIAPAEPAGVNTGFTGEYISIIEDLEEFIFLVFPNGTLADPDPVPDGTTPEEAIDDLLGGAQPEDPEPDEYAVIDKFRWKLLVLAVGMIMMLGSPIAGITYGADTATWIKLLFIMFFGLGILWQIKFM